jgi:hypothetical protein
MQQATANVLPAHSDHIAAPLPAVEAERKREALTRANGMRGLELRDLVFGPSVMPVTLHRPQLDAERRIIVDQIERDAMLRQRPSPFR